MLSFRTTPCATALLALALTFASCGSSDATDAASNRDPVPTAPGEADPSPPPAADQPAAPGDVGAGRATVTIEGETIEFDISRRCENRQDQEMLTAGPSTDGRWTLNMRYNRNNPEEETFEEMEIINDEAGNGWNFDVYTYGGEPSVTVGEVDWVKDGATITGTATFNQVFGDNPNKSAEGSFTIAC